MTGSRQPTGRRLTVPGLGGSGPKHWQSLWEAGHGFERVEQDDWNAPDETTWIARLEAAVREAGAGAVLAAHSLGCLAVGLWAERHPRTAAGLAGALLVAPPDPARPEFARLVGGFGHLAAGPLPFRAVLVSSADDPWCGAGFPAALARRWGCTRLALGPLGHLNASSRLGEWSEGLALVRALSAG